jgi:large subunit ribosomal protein L22
VPGVKTNERPGTRAVLRHYKMSATKARQVLDLIRGKEVDRAEELLRTTPREAARVISKVLASAVANAHNNDGLEPDELYVAACYADEGTTMKRWRPRARGRATRIRKRTCHITVIVARLPEDRLERRRSRQAAAAASRSRRVAASRRSGGAPEAEVAGEERPNRATRRNRLFGRGQPAPEVGDGEAAGEAEDVAEAGEAEDVAEAGEAEDVAEAGEAEDGGAAGEAEDEGAAGEAEPTGSAADTAAGQDEEKG